MWAQGLTVGTLISSALLSGVTSTENKVVEGRADHSWADMLGESISPILCDKDIADEHRARRSDQKVRIG